MPVRESGPALRLVWGPGAGVEAAGGLCLSRNEAGVVCIPQDTGELHRRKPL